MSFMFQSFDRRKTSYGSRADPDGGFDIADGFVPFQPEAGTIATAFGGPTSPFGLSAALVATVTTPTAASVAATVKTTVTTTTTTAGVTMLPAWVNTLKTAAIKTDVGAAVADGTITYAELLKVFSDVSSALTSTRTTLSSAQFADLKTFVSSLASGVSTSAYLISIASSMVNGSKANATWTGGATTAVSLGNLASGSTATQFSELLGKWFLGTDLPSSRVSMSGTATFNVSYSTVTKPLFAAAGPTMADVNQGYLGDCYLLSSLAEVADQNAAAIKSMFTDNGNGTYGVRFFVNGSATWTTVDTRLANGGTIFNYGGSDIWASLAEKAYAELQMSGVITGNIYSYGNSWSTIGNGGAPEYALEEITGASQITDFCGYRGSWTCNVYNSSLYRTATAAGLTTASVLNILIADIAAGDDVVLSSYTNAKDASGKTTLVAGHAMSIYGYDAKTGLLQIRNPWGTASGQTWATTFEVSLSTLLAAGDVITVDNVGTPTTTSTVKTTTTSTSTVKAVADVFDTSSLGSIDASAALFAQSIAATSGDAGSATAGLLASLAPTTATQLASPIA